MVIVVGDWRGIALRGLAAIAFGVLALVWPSITLDALIILYGAWALVDGIFTLVAVFTGEPETRGRRGWLIFEGLLGVAAGIVAFVWPGITALVLLYLIAVWAFMSGVIEIMAAIQLRKQIEREWLLVVAGLASIGFAVLLVITPGAGALAITWLIGWYAILFGVLLIALAWRVRAIQRQLGGGRVVPRLSDRHA